MKRIALVAQLTIVLGILMIYVLSTLYSPASAQAMTPIPTQMADITIGVSFSSETVKPGDEFDININMSTDLPSRGMQFILSFDPKLVELSGYTEGNFYKDFADTKSGGTTIVIPEPVIDNNQGLFPSTGISILGVPPGEGGASGSGKVMILHAKAKPNANGVAEFNVSDIRVADSGDASGRTQYYGGVKIQNGRLSIGGEAAAQPTVEALPTSTVVRRHSATATPGSNSASGESGPSIPWLFAIPAVGAVVVGVILFAGSRRR